MLSKIYNKNVKFIIIMFGVLLSFLVFQTYIEAKSTLDESGIESAFPESYKPYLRELARKHPNWKFVAVNLNLQWAECLSQETVDKKSLIPMSYSAEWKKSDVPVEPGWVNASDSAVAYAMDPRNFLTESGIFQFELTTNNSSIHTSDVIDKVLDGVPMGDPSLKRKYKKAGNWIDMDLSYSDYIAKSAISNNVSGVHLASRIRQETAGDIINNSSINGSYPGYEGYYNFFNIGATTANGDTPIVNALKRAKSEGWDTPEKSINAAGKKIYNDYTKWGQNTVYFEKWDVNDPTGGSSLFWMQYMSNILAPSSESNRMYIAYNKAGKLNSSFTFHIPVYLGMPREPAKVGDEARFEDDYTKVYLDDTSDIGVNDVFKIRSEPSTNASIVATITETQEGAKNRTKMTRIKKGINVQWDKVRLDSGIEGYVFSDYVYEYKDYIKVTSVKLNKNKTEIKSGNSESFTSTVLPSNAEFKKVNYTSNNETVMTVDKNGVVTARGLGAATLFAISDDNKNIYDTCYVSVAYTDILNVPMGKSINIMKDSYKNAIFSTNNSNVLSVTKDGKIIGNNLGDASVFVKDINGNVLSCFFVRVSYTESKILKIGQSVTIETKGSKYYTNNENVVTVSNTGVITTNGLGDATVFVEDANRKVIAMIYVKSSYTDTKNLKVGENVKLEINGTKYYTNNTNVVAVSNTGVITAVGLGDATVFVEDASGKLIAMVYVNNSYTDVKKLKVGESVGIQIKGNRYYTNNTNVVTVSDTGVMTARGLGDATVFVEDANRRVIAMIYVNNSYTDAKKLKVGESVGIQIKGNKYYTNNTNVVTVSNTGVMTARGLGDATIFVEDVTGKVAAMIYVNVSYTDSKKIKVGETVNAGIKAATYYTNNNTVLEVSNSGDITGRFLGDATVFAKDRNGAIVAMIYVSVIYTDNKTIYFEESVDIRKTFGLNDIKYNNAKFSTNNEKVAKISGQNIVGVSVGECTLYVKDLNNKNLAMFFVNVKEYVEVEKVVIDKTNVDLKVGQNYNLGAYVVPDNAKYKELDYISDNKEAVVVSDKGDVDAKFLGSSTITIKSTDKKTNKDAKCKINVGYTAHLQTDIVTSKNIKEVIDLNKIDVARITTNNEKVIKVDQNGNVTPTGIGDSSIFIFDGKGKLVALIYVKVIDYVKVSEIRLKEKEISLKVGKTHKINYEIIPSNAKYKDVEFKSNDTSICKVDQNGIVTSNFIGSAVVTIMTKDKDNIVYTQLKINNTYTDNLVLNQNQSINLLEYLKLPGNGSSYTFETNNTKVLSIDANTCVLRGISKGDASVFVRDRNGNFVAIVYVLVK